MMSGQLCATVQVTPCTHDHRRIELWIHTLDIKYEVYFRHKVNFKHKAPIHIHNNILAILPRTTLKTVVLLQS